MQARTGNDRTRNDRTGNDRTGSDETANDTARNEKARSELLTECACFDLRRATRAISRMYDDFMRDAGLNITQYSLLRVISREKELSISTLGRYMVIDRKSTRLNSSH